MRIHKQFGPEVKGESVTFSISSSLFLEPYLDSSNIVYGCVKFSNFCARISDCGLKFFGVSKIEFVGYMDDEYWNEGKGGVVDCWWF